MSLSPWGPQTTFSFSRALDPFLLLRNPGLLINLPRNLLSHQHQGSFLTSQFFVSGGQIIGASASASVLPMNIQDWFPLGWTRLDLLAVQGTLKSLLQHHSSKASVLQRSAFFIVQLSHPYRTTEKIIALTWWTFVSKVMSVLYKMLSRFVIVFPPRSKLLLISWLQSPSAVLLEPKKIKSVTVSIYLAWNDGTGCHDLGFLNVEL